VTAWLCIRRRSQRTRGVEQERLNLMRRFAELVGRVFQRPLVRFWPLLVRKLFPSGSSMLGSLPCESFHPISTFSMSEYALMCKNSCRLRDSPPRAAEKSSAALASASALDSIKLSSRSVPFCAGRKAVVRLLAELILLLLALHWECSQDPPGRNKAAEGACCIPLRLVR
jgi:hypothetical protein